MPRPRLQRAATARREKVQLRIREQSFKTQTSASRVPRRGRAHAAREHLISPMRFCLACLASKHIRGKSAALHMAKSDVGGSRGATNTACVLSQCVPHLRRQR